MRMRHLREITTVPLLCFEKLPLQFLFASTGGCKSVICSFLVLPNLGLTFIEPLKALIHLMNASDQLLPPLVVTLGVHGCELHIWLRLLLHWPLGRRSL